MSDDNAPQLPPILLKPERYVTVKMKCPTSGVMVRVNAHEAAQYEAEGWKKESALRTDGAPGKKTVEKSGSNNEQLNDN